MAVRTTATLVGGLIDVTSGVDLDPFILTANELVTEVCSLVTNSDASLYYSSTRLEIIERWLAAHFYSIYEPRAKNERAGSVGETIESKVGLGLDVTRYGQQAQLLDTNGGLAALDASVEVGKRRQVRVRWAGTEET